MIPLLLTFFLLGGVLASSGFAGEVEQWREKREAKLKAEDGWLTLIGLFWLKEGDNRVGSDPSAEISLPKDRAPGRVATLVLREGKVYLKPAPGVQLLVNGRAPTDQPLKSDRGNQEPDQITTGDFRFFVIWRSDKLAIRLKDKNSPYRTGFTGLKWYPPQAKYQLTAKWVPYQKAKKVVFDTMVGGKEEQDAPGYAVFTWAGQEYKLEPYIDEGELFFVFRDKTAGKTTYPAARFLRADMPKDGKVVLDFNKAYNPPCVFTPYATCPLPPPQNRLPFAVEAGEKMYTSQAFDASHH